MDIPISQVTESVLFLQLFPVIQEKDYQALVQAGSTPVFNAGNQFKAWVDPNALTAAVTEGPDPLTGIWYIDPNNVIYPVLTISCLSEPPYTVTATYTHEAMTRQEASQYNCPDPSTIAYAQAFARAGLNARIPPSRRTAPPRRSRSSPARFRSSVRPARGWFRRPGGLPSSPPGA